MMANVSTKCSVRMQLLGLCGVLPCIKFEKFVKIQGDHSVQAGTLHTLNM